MNPYADFVSDFAGLVAKARSLPLGNFPPPTRPALAADAPKALFFAPHPDDECIVGGGIALRLMREARMDVLDVAVTLGSNPQRQPERLIELENACRYLGLDLVPTGPRGLERITPKARAQDPTHWAACVDVVANLLATHRPSVVLCPHERDWNSTHVGTHFLVLDALKRMPPDFECHVVETEFWGQMTDPNLMLEISPADLADQIAATTFHLGEIARNPYHVLLPAWMMNNVMRGCEIVGGQGGKAPDFTYAAIYRLRKWRRGRLARTFKGGRFVACSANIGDLFLK